MMRALPFILLIMIAAGFGWIGVAPWQGKAPARLAPAGGAPEKPAPPAFTFPGPPSTDLAPFLERPPFSAARRPPPPENPGLALPSPDLGLVFGRYQITGVVMLGPSALAMLRDTSGSLLRIRPGDQIETATGAADVIEITLETLTFRHQGDTVTLPVGGGETRTE